jgi:predicted TIM-barrel fold metal-dependent hydrolase
MGDHRPAALVRRDASHPIIDADGHITELLPVFEDYLVAAGGPQLAQALAQAVMGFAAMTVDGCREAGFPRPPWWGVPARPRDRLTVSLPRLRHARMDEVGLDFAVLFPTLGSMLLSGRAPTELRLAGCRAYNAYVAEQYRPYADRLTPAALIPMDTPDAALAALEHAAGLGLKVALIAAHVVRPIPAVARAAPPLAARFGRLDTFGIDGEHDYDPVWARCVALKMPAVMHGFGLGWNDRNSPSNYMYNHIGNFAAAQEAVCKSLFLGGVTRRFPTLRFGFLEGGVSWACRLYADLLGHWQKRNVNALRAHLDPALLDPAEAAALCREYGGPAVESRVERVVGSLIGTMSRDPGGPLDEFAPCQIERPEDVRELFVPNFYFGCEADDPLTAWAFNDKVNPLGARLKVVCGSDIGHWDVPDVAAPVAEAYEMVEHGLLSAADFRAFVCDNPLELFAGLNPGFFDGTPVEAYARAHHARPAT